MLKRVLTVLVTIGMALLLMGFGGCPWSDTTG